MPPLRTILRRQRSRLLTQVQGLAPAFAVFALALFALSLCAPFSARAETNLAKNGGLSAGSGNAPNDWYALSSDKKLTTFSWTKTPGDGGVLAINNLNQNIASWHQALILAPGLYEISAEVRV